MDKYTVIVGNIGTVYIGNSFKESQHAYEYYIKMSEKNMGRCAGESVVWFRDEEVYKEYIGTQNEI